MKRIYTEIIEIERGKRRLRVTAFVSEFFEISQEGAPPTCLHLETSTRGMFPHEWYEWEHRDWIFLPDNTPQAQVIREAIKLMDAQVGESNVDESVKVFNRTG